MFAILWGRGGEWNAENSMLMMIDSGSLYPDKFFTIGV
jgi:hypothetical protein